MTSYLHNFIRMIDLIHFKNIWIYSKTSLVSRLKSLWILRSWNRFNFWWKLITDLKPTQYNLITKNEWFIPRDRKPEWNSWKDGISYICHTDLIQNENNCYSNLLVCIRVDNSLSVQWCFGDTLLREFNQTHERIELRSNTLMKTDGGKYRIVNSRIYVEFYFVISYILLHF